MKQFFPVRAIKAGQALAWRRLSWFFLWYSMSVLAVQQAMAANPLAEHHMATQDVLWAASVPTSRQLNRQPNHQPQLALAQQTTTKHYDAKGRYIGKSVEQRRARTRNLGSAAPQPPTTSPVTVKHYDATGRFIGKSQISQRNEQRQKKPSQTRQRQIKTNNSKPSKNKPRQK